MIFLREINDKHRQYQLPLLENEVVTDGNNAVYILNVLHRVAESMTKTTIFKRCRCRFFYSLISSLKTYHRTLHFTPWSLDLFIHVPFQLPGEHTVLQPFRRIELIVHIAISVLPGTHFHLSRVKHLRVKCLAQGRTILTMSKD